MMSIDYLNPNKTTSVWRHISFVCAFTVLCCMFIYRLFVLIGYYSAVWDTLSLLIPQEMRRDSMEHGCLAGHNIACALHGVVTVFGILPCVFIRVVFVFLYEQCYNLFLIFVLCKVLPDIYYDF